MSVLAPRIFLSVLALVATAASAENLYPLDSMQQAEAAYSKGDYAAFLKDAENARQLIPTDPSALYLLARAYALQNRKAEAIAALTQAIDIGGIEVDGAAAEKDFASLREMPEFAAALKKIDALKAPLRHSNAAFVIPEKALVPEGTAYDPVSKTLFISSIYKRKIVAIAADGTIRDFIPEKSDGIWGVAGMEVDPERRHLWVASGAGPVDGFIKDATPADRGKTGIFKYDVDTGKLITKYLPDSSTGPGFFNDLTISKSGDVYITDTSLGLVWRIPAATDKLEVFIPPAPQSRRFHNGIAIAPDDRYLFVAHAFGIDLVDLATKEQVAIAHPDNVTLGGVDGLSYYKNSLIAHQNASIASINRYYLSPDMKRVLRREIIDSRLPEFQSPTTGAVAGDDYYYIANSQIRTINKGKTQPDELYKDVIILKSKLR